ncbi:MAG: hypothetical protein ABI613_06680 [Gemmatimonadota bacterium]
MTRNFLLHFRACAVGVALVAGAAACQRDDTTLPSGAPETGDLAIHIEVSSRTAAAGDRIAVAVNAEAHAPQPLIGLQGSLLYDASRLTYLGQSDEGPFAIVNAQKPGLIRAASLDVNGLSGRTAVFVFQVKSSSYDKGLGYLVEAAGTRDMSRLNRSTVDVKDAADLTVPAAPRLMTLLDWRVKMTPAGKAIPVDRPSQNPGEYRLNLKYGDATLDGVVDVVGDAFYIANVAVGNSQLISGTSSPDRDAVVAGNVDPFNTPGLGEPTDAVPPGLESNGTRLINIFDAAAIANEAVGNNPPVVGDIIPGRGPLATNRIVVSGNVAVNTSWTKNNIYELSGTVTVGNLVEPCSAASVPTLTIQAGTRIEGQNLSVLEINRCGKVDAQGTLLEPIVMTCDATTKVAGCWGGFVIDGNAPINNGTLSSPGNRGDTGTCLEQAGEGGTSTYGGCNPNDNSGIVKYVVVDYAGTRFTATNERNSLTLQGVGSGTTLDFIQTHGGLDDGIESFGGNPTIKHLLVTAVQDDGFDWVAGFRGKAQYVIVQSCPVGCDRGIEADNFGIDSGDPEAAPRSAPTLYNFTLVGTTTAGQGASLNGILLRQNTAGFLRNFVVYRWPNGLDIDQPSGAAGGGLNLSGEICTQLNTGNGVGDNTLPANLDNLGLSFRYGLLAGNTNAGSTDGSDPGGPPGTPGSPPFTCGGYTHDGTNLEAVYLGTASNHLVTSAATTGVLIDAENTLTPDFRPVVGGPVSTTAATATPSDPFFDPAGGSFVGAVAPGAAIPWFSGWTHGWQSATTP